MKVWYVRYLLGHRMVITELATGTHVQVKMGVGEGERIQVVLNLEENCVNILLDAPKV